jgi:predicted metal-dependent hydrolase
MHLIQNNFSSSHKLQINYTKRKKTLAIKLSSNQIIINAPKFTSQKLINNFLKKHNDWIAKKIAYLQAKEANKSANQIDFLGKKIALVTNEGNKTSYLDFKNDKLTYHPKLTSLQKEFLLKNWYKHQAINIIQTRFKQISTKINFTATKLTFKFLQSQWGNCNRRKEIKLNIWLVKLPLWVIDYVIIHELCHLEEMNHSKKFWQLVAKFCPQYKEANKFLKSVNLS